MAEHKLTVNKDAVQISSEGHVTITDPKVVQQLKERGVTKTADLNKAAVSVGVVVSF
jgi:hypothetical protein